MIEQVTWFGGVCQDMVEAGLPKVLAIRGLQVRRMRLAGRARGAGVASETALGCLSDMVEAGLPKVLATCVLQVSEAHEACWKNKSCRSGE
jgi:hypothetical protein